MVALHTAGRFQLQYEYQIKRMEISIASPECLLQISETNVAESDQMCKRNSAYRTLAVQQRLEVSSSNLIKELRLFDLADKLDPAKLQNSA